MYLHIRAQRQILLPTDMVSEDSSSRMTRILKDAIHKSTSSLEAGEVLTLPKQPLILMVLPRLARETVILIVGNGRPDWWSSNKLRSQHLFNPGSRAFNPTSPSIFKSRHALVYIAFHSLVECPGIVNAEVSSWFPLRRGAIRHDGDIWFRCLQALLRCTSDLSLPQDEPSCLLQMSRYSMFSFSSFDTVSRFLWCYFDWLYPRLLVSVSSQI